MRKKRDIKHVLKWLNVQVPSLLQRVSFGREKRMNVLFSLVSILNSCAIG